MFARSAFMALSLSFLASAVAQNIPSNISVTFPYKWTYQYLGCYSDSAAARVLENDIYVNYTSMTQEMCVQYCSFHSLSVAGVEYSGECYCGRQIASISQKEPDTDCNMACAGNSSEVCGGGNRITVFSTGAAPPSPLPAPPGWQYLGCYNDSISSRTLRFAQNNFQATYTLQNCIGACQNYGFQFAGVEYGQECWCDNSIASGAGLAVSGCDMACRGNASQLCGGSNRLNLYSAQNANAATAEMLPAGWSSLGCFTDTVSARTLGISEGVLGGPGNMTVNNCLSACHQYGYTLAGVEYSRECYCGVQLSNGGSCASDQTTCNMPCNGNSAETCGGANRLNLYGYSGYPNKPGVASCGATASTVSSTTSTPTASTLTTATSTPTMTSTTSSSTPSITGPAMCNSTPAPSSSLVVNGEFESGSLAPWTLTYDTPYYQPLSASVMLNGSSLDGCGCLSVSSPATIHNTGGRVKFTQKVSGFVPNNFYTVSLAIGRLPSASLLSGSSVEIYMEDKPWTYGYVCGTNGKACTTPGNNGTTWEAMTFKNYYVQNTSFDVGIELWTTGLDAADSPILFDAINIYKQSGAIQG